MINEIFSNPEFLNKKYKKLLILNGNLILVE